MRITESQLRKIVREEASRLLEMGSYVRPGPDISDPDADHFATFSDPHYVADAIIEALGDEGAADLHQAVMDGDHTADAELQELIGDLSDGALDGGDVGVQDEVLAALAAALGSGRLS